MNVRFVAANIIDDVTNGRSLTDSLNTALLKLKDPRDRALVRDVLWRLSILSTSRCRFKLFGHETHAGQRQ